MISDCYLTLCLVVVRGAFTLNGRLAVLSS